MTVAMPDPRPPTAAELGLETSPTTNLCHYTSQEGLIGILKTKAIYATDATFMNDSQEVVYAVTLARKFIKRESKLDGRSIQNMLNILDQTETAVPKLPVYVASFSEEPDLLSQWRGYCPKGPGFALCVSPVRVTKLAQHHNWTLLKCVYDESVQLDVIKKLFDWSATTTSTPREVAFGIVLLSYASAFKHPKFREESEWRAIVRVGGTPSVRPGASTLVPYVDFPLTIAGDKVELAALVVGPTPHPKLALRAAQNLLTWKDTVCPAPVSSEIPFRNW